MAKEKASQLVALEDRRRKEEQELRVLFDMRARIEVSELIIEQRIVGPVRISTTAAEKIRLRNEQRNLEDKRDQLLERIQAFDEKVIEEITEEEGDAVGQDVRSLLTSTLEGVIEKDLALSRILAEPFLDIPKALDAALRLERFKDTYLKIRGSQLESSLLQ